MKSYKIASIAGDGIGKEITDIKNLIPWSRTAAQNGSIDTLAFLKIYRKIKLISFGKNCKYDLI